MPEHRGISAKHPVRASDPSLADQANGWKSAYVHIPFCAKRCPYCDFAIVDESRGGEIDYLRYVEALLREIAMEDTFGPLHAVNIGGGTPSRLHATQLGRIVDALEGRFGFADGIEISLEVNPEDWEQGVAEGLADSGFTRVSVGAQSFDSAVLSVLGREHSVTRTAEVVASARVAGFRSVSVDLIYGHPVETAQSWSATVDFALDLPIDHISTYALTVEAGTALSREVMSGGRSPDDDVQAARYEIFSERAADAGFDRYEVSNHARPGHACRYNLSTWAHGEYLGFGMGAHDHRWGRRSRNHRRLDRYLTDIADGVRPRLGTETLDDEAQERDRFMLGLRLAAGAPPSALAVAFIESAAGVRLVEAGVVRVEGGGRVVVARPMLTDAVLREALSVSAGDC